MLRVLNDNVLVKPYKEETKSTGGIIVSLDEKKKESRGTVVGVGSKVSELIKIKDEVIYAKYAGTELTTPDGIEYIVVKESDILAVINLSEYTAPKKKG